MVAALAARTATAIAALAGAGTAGAQTPTLFIDPSRLAPIGTIDPRFQRMLEHIQARTKKPIFDTWFRNLELVSVDDDIIRIGTPNQFVKKWIEESELMHTLCDAVREGFERSLVKPVLRRFVIARPDERAVEVAAVVVPEEPDDDNLL